MSDRTSIEKEKFSITENVRAAAPDEISVAADMSEGAIKRVLRKMDIHLLPFVSLLYLLSFLDRANIGNAKIAGMSDDLHLDGLKYNVSAAVFFIPYALAEVPSNILLKVIRPSRWIPSIMVAWGLVMTLMCLCNTYKSLVIARVFLGLTESGLFPGVTFYLSLWYPRSKQAKRVALFFSAATIAGAFGGLLAFGIEKMDGIGKLHGWQWIFCLEGIATVLVAIVAFFLMHDYPETAKFLTSDERATIITLLKEDSKALASHYDIKFVYQALKDYKTFVQVGIYLGLLIPVYAIALFTPTIVKQLGYTAANAQLLTIPPFVIGCFATIAAGILSDKYSIRGPFVILGCTISMVGYIILYTVPTPGVAYFGAILAAVGVYPCIPVDLAWAGSNAGGAMKRGVCLALVIGIGNLGGVCSSFIYKDPPRFHLGHGVCMGCLGFSIVLSVFAMWNYRRINLEKEKYCQTNNIDDSRREEFAELGDGSPLFRYVL